MEEVSKVRSRSDPRVFQRAKSSTQKHDMIRSLLLLVIIIIIITGYELAPNPLF